MRAARLICPGFAVCAIPRLAEAHPGAGPVGWTFDPYVLVPLLLAGSCYAGGLAALWRRAGVGRGAQTWRIASYAAGWITLASALISPLHAAGERLFAAHMIEHEIIMIVAAPLLVLARPAPVLLWVWPITARRWFGGAIHRRTVRTVWSIITLPLFATMAHGAAIWAWHIPALLDATVTQLALHRVQHLSFLLTALLFWWALCRNARPGAAAGHVLVTMMHTGLLGALLTFAPRVLYTTQTAHASEWGLTPLEDQQLAGLVMWIPAGLIYAGAALGFAARWIQQSSAADERRDSATQRIGLPPVTATVAPDM